MLIIGETGQVDAEIDCGVVSIRGKVTGTVHGRQRIELLAGCRVQATLVTPKLVIEDGAFFQGDCRMGEPPERPPPRRRRRRRPGRLAGAIRSDGNERRARADPPAHRAGALRRLSEQARPVPSSPRSWAPLPSNDPRVLVDQRTGDDAGVYRLDEDGARPDRRFLHPGRGRPRAFGAIAAANALSDVYAMGGRPITALSIAAFPEERFPLEWAQAIVRGRRRRRSPAAGCALLGGHTRARPGDQVRLRRHRPRGPRAHAHERRRARRARCSCSRSRSAPA